MKTLKPLLRSFTIVGALAFLAAGCEKAPTSIANNSGSQAPPVAQPALPVVQPTPQPIQAEPFHGQVYKALNGRTVLTLVSKDECEIAENGTTLLCKYTKQDGKLRVVTTALGTSTVLYFRFTDQGLDDNQGHVLFSPEKFEAALEQIQQKQREETRAREEKERVAKMMSDATSATQTIATFELSPPTLIRMYQQFTPDGNAIRTVHNAPSKLELTDVSLNVYVYAAGPYQHYEYSIAFARIRKIGGVGEGTANNGFLITAEPSKEYIRDGSGNNNFSQTLYAASEANAASIHDTVLKAYSAWKEKFPEAVLK